MKQKILDFLRSSVAKKFYWETTNGFILLLIGTITVIQPDIINPFLIALTAIGISVLNMITKYININIL